MSRERRRRDSKRGIRRKIQLELDPTIGTLYLRLAAGRVADTIELDDLIVADRDANGATLGIGFVHGEDFAPFLLRHPEVVALPSRLAYASLDTGRVWEVDSGVDENVPTGERAGANARVHGGFVDRLLADASLVDRIPHGTLLRVSEGNALAYRG